MNRFIDEHRDVYGVEPICKVLPIAPSTYHEHAARRADPSRIPVRMQRDEALCVDTMPPLLPSTPPNPKDHLCLPVPNTA